MGSHLTPLFTSILLLLAFFLDPSFSAAYSTDEYIGCYNENTTNPIFTVQKTSKDVTNPIRPNRCQNLCKGYRFIALRNGNLCFCGDVDYTMYGKADESACNMPCASGNANCGGTNAISVYRITPCSSVCNNHSTTCQDSGPNMSITTCQGCLGNTMGTYCQSCLPEFYGFSNTSSCQYCNCGAGAFNSSCDAITGDCFCKPDFLGSKCDSCTVGKFVNVSTCSDCACNSIGSNSTSCNQATGQCVCNPNFGGRDCSSCNPGYELAGDYCIDVDECERGTHSCSPQATCANTIGSYTCTCNQGYLGDGLTCTDINECTVPSHNCSAQATCTNLDGSFSCACDPGFSGDGVSCADVDECTVPSHNCSAVATCTNTFGGFLCTCNPGYYGSGDSCSDIDECAIPSHNCSALATCTNTDGAYTCSCLTGYSGDGFSCQDIDECSEELDDCDHNAACDNTVGSFTCTCNPGYYGTGVLCQATCNCGIGSQSSICDPQTGECPCLPGFASPTCSQCLPGKFGSNCTACPACVRGTCNDGLNGNGTCSCEPGWAPPLCSACLSGKFGSNCSGTCPSSCGRGSCSQGTQGSGACICQTGWKNNGSLPCSMCEDGYYLSNGECLACHPTCLTCSGGSNSSCLSCPASLLKEGSSCVNVCPSGKYLEVSTSSCQACDASCKECSGPSAQACTACPTNRLSLGSTCLLQCPQAYFINSGACTACHSSCASCDGDAKTDCTSCPPSFFLNPANGKCVSQCPNGTFVRDNVCLTCSSSCLTCSGTSDSSCLSCETGKIFFDGQCLTKCPSGYFRSGSTCTACQCNSHSSDCDATSGICKNCEGFTTGDHCEQCLENYVASNTSLGCIPNQNPTTSSAGNSSEPVAIGVGVSVGVLLIALAGVIAIIVRSRKSRKIDPLPTGKGGKEEEFHTSMDLELACTTLRESAAGEGAAPTLLNTELGKELSLPGYLKLSYQEDVRVERTLTGGGGGSISLGAILNTDMRIKYPSCADRVAIKKIFSHESLTAEENRQLFHQEVSVMSALSYHPNIAKVLFYTEDPSAIVFPMYESDLHHLIHTPSLTYSPSHMRDILLQIAIGMQAVHGLEIAHRDLKPANFLLEANPKAELEGKFPFTIKITDFGVCYVTHSSVSSQKFINVFGVSVRYAAPEVFSRMMMKKFEGEIHELAKSDVYSYAISAWELITRKNPWEAHTADDIQALVSSGERPPLRESTHDPLLATLEDLVRLCWKQEHSQRPTFRDIASKLVRLF